MRRVNHLPVLTWNKLDFNEAKMPAGVTFDRKDHRTEVQLPQGMRKAGELDRAAFLEWSSAHGCANVPEAIVAGKFPMYAQEQFQTGMGAEIDDMLDEAGVKTQLYEVEGVHDEPVKFEYVYPDKTASADAVLIHVKKGASLTLIQYFTGKEGSGFVGSSTRVYLEEGAKMQLVKVQMLAKDFVFFDDLGVKQQAEAEFTFIPSWNWERARLIWVHALTRSGMTACCVRIWDISRCKTVCWITIMWIHSAGKSHRA